MATQAPVELPPELKVMIRGLLRASAVAEGGATLKLDFGGALPVFQLLPCKEAEAGGGGDDEEGWGDDD